MSKPKTEHNPAGTGDKTLRELGLTLMHPFFGEEKRLLKLFEILDAWSDDLKDNVQIILIDDHGTPSVKDMISDKTMDYNLSVYRIQDDLKFNTPGALNLGMMLAATPWILTMDSDCTFEPDVMQKLLDFKPEQKNVYHFFRNRITDDPKKIGNVRVLPCTLLLHKDAFIEVNGFDEDYTGEWSTELMKHVPGYENSADVEGYATFDNAFMSSVDVAGYGRIHQRGYIVDEWMPDKVGTKVLYSFRETLFNKRLFRAKLNGFLPFSTDMLRFKWKRVMHNIRGRK